MMALTGWKFRCLMICFLMVSVGGEEEEGECLQAMTSLIEFHKDSMAERLQVEKLISLHIDTEGKLQTLTSEVKENYKEFQKKIDAISQPDTQEVDPPLESQPDQLVDIAINPIEESSPESVSLELIPMGHPTDGIHGSPHTISFKRRDESTYKHWVSSLNDFIEAYEGREYQNYRDCNSDQYKWEKENGKPRNSRACKFSDMWLGPYCQKREHWGFRGFPCIILKLNTTLNWEPNVYTNLKDLPAEMPLTLKDRITEMTQSYNGKVPPMVWLSCMQNGDNDDLNIDVGPFLGFPAYYFPRNEINGYLAPLVGVTLKTKELNVAYVLNIECRAWTKNIIRESGEGLLQFQLRMN